MSLLKYIFIAIHEILRKIIDLFLVFIFSVWELIIINTIIIILLACILYKSGFLDYFGNTYADEPLPQTQELKTYFYIDFDNYKLENTKHK